MLEMTHTSAYCATGHHQYTITDQDHTDQVVVNWVEHTYADWISHVDYALSEDSAVKTVESAGGEVGESVVGGLENGVVGADVCLGSFEGSVIVVDVGFITIEGSCDTTHTGLSWEIPVVLQIFQIFKVITRDASISGSQSSRKRVISCCTLELFQNFIASQRARCCWGQVSTWSITGLSSRTWVQIIWRHPRITLNIQCSAGDINRISN